ncbi:MAG: choice-of-anchor M domain-containing protein [Verrucomicrobiota bacterium JB023]|nr:choice-of-anchor M domain-containing protein [Verrucomicrobiota bacterium JB023]
MNTNLMQGSLLLGAFFGMVATGSASTLWTGGHGDIGVGYEDEGDGPELHFHLHLGEGSGATVGGVLIGESEFEAESVGIWMDNPVQINSTDPSLLSGIGTTTGSTVYLLPQSAIDADIAGVPFVGFGTEELVAADWGPVTISLDSVVGPGEFSVYQPDGLGGFNFAMSTADGIDGSDSFTRSAGGHDHFNIVFTEAGTYEVTMTVSATHVTDGLQTSTETFTFTSIPEPGTALLSLLGMVGLIGRRRR